MGPGLQPQLCLSSPGPVALGRCPILSDLQFSLSTLKLLDDQVSMQNVASEPHSSLKCSQCREVFPGVPEMILPLDHWRGVQAGARSLCEVLEVEPQVRKGS